MSRFSVPVDARLGQAQVGAAQAARRPRVVVAPLVVDLGAQRAQGIDVDVDRPSADAVAARIGDDDLARRPSIGPSRTNDARRRLAASSGMKSQSSWRAWMRSSCSPTQRASAPRSHSTSRMYSTSAMRGALVIVHGSSHSTAAAMSFKTAFLAPEIGSVRATGRHPRSRYAVDWGAGLAIIAAGLCLGHT